MRHNKKTDYHSISAKPGRGVVITIKKWVKKNEKK
jgi:hypothetical protein